MIWGKISYLFLAEGVKKACWDDAKQIIQWMVLSLGATETDIHTNGPRRRRTTSSSLRLRDCCCSEDAAHSLSFYLLIFSSLSATIQQTSHKRVGKNLHIVKVIHASSPHSSRSRKRFLISLSFLSLARLRWMLFVGHRKNMRPDT